MVAPPSSTPNTASSRPAPPLPKSAQTGFQPAQARLLCPSRYEPSRVGIAVPQGGLDRLTDLRRAGKRLSEKSYLHEAGATGLEPATSGVTGRRSNQLSYAPERNEMGRWGAAQRGKSSGWRGLAAESLREVDLG